MSKSISLNVKGMKCSSCEAAITEKLFANDGVIAVTASHKGDYVAVEYEKRLTNTAIIKQIVEDAGYQVE
jgi:copper chaperone CopZ